MNYYTMIYIPFRLFPLALSSSILGIHVYSFRIVGIIGLITLFLFLTKIFIKRYELSYTLLITLSIIFIPLLAHTSYIVEPSIWTSLSWTGVLIFIFYGDKSNKSFLLWFSILSIASLMRASAFVGLIPLSLHWFFTKVNFQNLKTTFTLENLKVFSPVLVMLPYTFSSLLGGSPATGSELTTLESIQKSVEGFLSIKMAYNAVFFPWILFFPFSFWFKHKNEFIYSFILLFFFSLSYVMFYSIRPVLWGLGRYQAEFILPFVILGMVNVFQFIYQKNKIFTIFPFTTLILYGLYIIVNYPTYSEIRDESIFPGVKSHRIKGISEIVYDTSKPLQKMKQEGLSHSTYIEGITYGTMPNILAGYTLKEIQSVSKIGHRGMSVEDIHKNSQIQAVILTDWCPTGPKKEQLMKLGWKLVDVYKNGSYKTSSFLLVRTK